MSTRRRRLRVPRLRKPRPARIATVVASFNAHIGDGLTHFGLRWLLLRFPNVSIVLVQEGRGVDNLARNLTRLFKHYPKRQPAKDPKRIATAAMTYIAWLRVRYRLQRGWNLDIQNGEYPRRMTAVLLWDRWLRRSVLVVNLHLDPMGLGWDAPEGVVDKHQDQAEDYLDFIDATMAEYPDALVVVGGDTNERLHAHTPDKYRDRAIRYALARRGFKPAHMGSLDGVWFNDGDPTGRAVAVPKPGMDHPATIARTRTRRRKRTPKR